MNEPWDDRFRTLLASQLGDAVAARLTSDDDLFDKGLNSLGVVALVVAVEESYAIEFPDEALDRETFRTPGRLWATVAGLLPRVQDGGGDR